MTFHTKTSMGAKSLCIWFDKIVGFIKTHNGIKSLVLFDYLWFDKICERVKNLISEKSGIRDSINHNFQKTRIDSYNSIPIRKQFS